MTGYLLGYAALACFTAFIAALLIWPELKANPKRSGGMIALFLVACVSLYAVTGTPRLLLDQAERDATREAVLATLGEKEKHAEQNPESASAWADLGDSYLKAGRPGLAMQALKQAVVLSNGEPALLLAYGKSIVIASGGNVTDEAAEAFRMALLQLDDPQAKLFIAIHTAGKGDTEKAKTMLKGLIEDAKTPKEVRNAATEQLKQLIGANKR